MGLNKSEKAIYLKIVEGKLAQVCKSDTPGAEKFTTKDGEDKYYLFYKSLTGILENISVKMPPDNQPNWKPNWNLKFVDGDEVFYVQIPFSGGYANVFFHILKNIEAGIPIVFTPSFKRQEYQGKMKDNYGVFVKQNGMPLKWFYSKENDNLQDIPALDIQKFKSGKTTYDDTERNEFFKKLANEYSGKCARSALDVIEEVNEEVNQVNEESDDGLPF